MIFPGMRRKTPSARQRAAKRPEKFAANGQKRGQASQNLLKTDDPPRGAKGDKGARPAIP